MLKSRTYLPRGKWNMAGRRFGKMTVIKFIPTAKNKRYPGRHWLLRCTCGNEQVVPGQQFVYGGNVPCRCTPYGHCLPLGEAAKRRAYRQMKHAISYGRKRLGLRSVKWALTYSQFVAITSKACRYCGVPWSKETGNTGNKKAKLFGSYRYNGIDRIDSSKGYVLGNCAAACKKCNYAKNAMTESDFKTHITRMYNHFVMEKQHANAA